MSCRDGCSGMGAGRALLPIFPGRAQASAAAGASSGLSRRRENPRKKEGERRGKRLLLRAAWFPSAKPSAAAERGRARHSSSAVRCLLAAPAPRHCPGSHPPLGSVAATNQPARSLRPVKVKSGNFFLNITSRNTHLKLKQKGETPALRRPKAPQIQIKRIVEKYTRNRAEAATGATLLPATIPPQRPQRGPPGPPLSDPPRRRGPRHRSHPLPGLLRARRPRP